MAFSAVTERGSTSTKVSGASLGVSPSANLTVGKIVFAVLAFDNLATTDGATTTNDTLTDTDGHTWTKVCEQTNTNAGVAADGVTGSLWWTKVTTQIDTGDVVTFNTDSAVLAKCIGLFEVTVGAGNTIQLAGSTFLETSGTDPSQMSLSGLVNQPYLFLGISWNESPSTAMTWTEATNYTNVFAAEGFGSSGSGSATNVSVNIGYRIITLGTGDNFDVGGLVNTEHALAFLAFEEVTGASLQTLTGSLFTKAPTFFTGAITSVYALTGTLFTKAPTFNVGTITATRTLTGALFVKAPTFFTGTVTPGAVALTGSLFTKAPTFFTGSVTLTTPLTGVLFVKAPTFFTGTVTSGVVTLTGTLFTKAPTFPTGAVTTTVSLTGTLFQNTPTFPTGTVASSYTLTGTLYVNTPTFPAGTIGQTGTIFGNLYVNTPVFFTGLLAQGGPSFWQPNPAGWTANPSGFVRVGRYGPSPWGAELSGRRFEKAPTFPVGTVT